MPSAGFPRATLVEEAVALLQRDIVSGALPPESKLGIRTLTASYGIGPTPLREALSRMSETGLIRARGRHGFAVAPMSRDDLADILWLRRMVEAEALRRAMGAGGGAWEAEIVASLHLLRQAVLKREAARSGAPDLPFDAVHSRFHVALIAACGSDRLLGLAAGLYTATFRYRTIAMATQRWTRDVVAEHERLADLALARDPAAPAALDAHIADVLAMVFPDPAPPP